MSTLFKKRKNNKKEPSNQTTKNKRKRSEGHGEGDGPIAIGPSIHTQDEQDSNVSPVPYATAAAWATFEDLGLAPPLVKTCRNLGFTRPTPVQRTMIPFLLHEEKTHALALAATGSGKTAAFVLPILQNLQADPYGIYAVILTPTRELAKQIHQQVLALGSKPYRVQSALVVGGLGAVHQSCQLDRRPHFCVATPGRLAELLRGPQPPRLQHVRYLVLDEADRLLASGSGFERDVAELLLHCRSRPNSKCQTLLFSATMTKSLESIEEMAGGGHGKLSIRKFIIKQDRNKDGEDESKSGKNESKKQKNTATDDDDDDDDEEGSDSEAESSTPKIPEGLRQEYVFMPSRVRDAYLVTTIRTLMANGGRRGANERGGSGWTSTNVASLEDDVDDNDDDEDGPGKARSAVVFVGTCERAGMVSGILSELGVENVSLHSLLSQNRRLAALGKFKSQHVRVMVATDVASRGLDIPSVDLVINAELPRNAVNYVHRVGRTARAGRRGRAVSLVSESDVALVHAAEKLTKRPLLKCADITDDTAVRLLGPVTKAARLAKMKLMDIGFDELVKKMKSRKAQDRKERERVAKALAKSQRKQERRIQAQAKNANKANTEAT